MQATCKKIFLLFFLIVTYITVVSYPIFAAENVSLEQQPIQEVIRIEVNGTINKQLTYDNIMYLIGDFTQVKLSGSTAISRNNIAAIDLKTQSLLPWNPSFDGVIFDIEAYDKYLFLAGEFTQMNGEAHPYFVVIDRTNNTILEPPISVNGPVYAVERYNSTLFVGGDFSLFAGTNRSYLVSFHLDSSTLNTWAPSLNGSVRALVVHDNILYVAGEFTQIEKRPQQYVVAFYLPSGEQSTWSPNISYPVQNMNYRDDALVITYNNPDTQQSVDSFIPLESITQMPIPSVIALSENSVQGEPEVQGLMVDTSKLGFAIPTLSDLLTFAVRVFFVIAGLAALFYMLIGAFSWVTSGGDKDAVAAAREKIQSAVVGLIMMVVVLAIVWTLEQVVFKRRICLGVSCPLTFPSLLEPIN